MPLERSEVERACARRSSRIETRLGGVCHDPACGTGRRAGREEDPGGRGRHALRRDRRLRRRRPRREAKSPSSSEPRRPDFVITTGDNNYPDGDAATIDREHRPFLPRLHPPLRRALRPGATENRFFPVARQPRLAHRRRRALPRLLHAARQRALLRLRARATCTSSRVDSDAHEPDGIEGDVDAGAVARARARARRRRAWQVVYMHHPPVLVRRARLVSPSCSGPTRRGAPTSCSPDTTTPTSASSRTASRTS